MARQVVSLVLHLIRQIVFNACFPLFFKDLFCCLVLILGCLQEFRCLICASETCLKWSERHCIHNVHFTMIFVKKLLGISVHFLCAYRHIKHLKVVYWYLSYLCTKYNVLLVNTNAASSSSSSKLPRWLAYILYMYTASL